MVVYALRFPSRFGCRSDNCGGAERLLTRDHAPAPRSSSIIVGLSLLPVVLLPDCVEYSSKGSHFTINLSIVL